MPPKWLLKFLPTKSDITTNHKYSWLSNKLHDPELWHFNKHSVSRGVAAGFLVLFIPLPIQIISATAFAVLFRGNILIAIALTWLSNPLTFIPINWFLYEVGHFILQDTEEFKIIPEFRFSSDTNYFTQLITWLKSIGKPILVSLPIVSIAASLLGFALVHIFWSIKDLISKHIKS